MDLEDLPSPKHSLVDIIFYPVDLSITLVQLGYFPHALRKWRSSHVSLYNWPSVPEYINALYEAEGLSGLTRGMCASVTGVFIRRATVKSMKEKGNPSLMKLVWNELPRNESNRNPCLVIALSAIKHSVGVIASHPFHVVATRQAAQFIGKETTYSGFLIDPFIQVFKQNGVSGFFAGLLPRLISQIITWSIVDFVGWGVKKYIVDANPDFYEGPNNGMFIIAVAQRMALTAVNIIMNPLQVVSTNMEVVQSGLRAGRPPYMPEYVSCWECWYSMYKNDFLDRRIGIFPTFKATTDLGNVLQFDV